MTGRRRQATALLSGPWFDACLGRLYVSAAHIPQAKHSLWEHVYVRRFGFTRVAGLRANLDDPDNPDEPHEIPPVVRVGALRALWVRDGGAGADIPKG